MRMCFAKLLASDAQYEHIEHTYGFSPVCIRSCALRDDDVLVVKGQTMQLYGFSPVCLRACRSKSDARCVTYAHCEQLCDFWPLLYLRLATGAVGCKNREGRRTTLAPAPASTASGTTTANQTFSNIFHKWPSLTAAHLQILPHDRCQAALESLAPGKQ